MDNICKTSDELIVDEIERITSLKFSDEQRDILCYRGNMVIVACAGSGKTSILINLIAKRIWNREISDTTRMICTTYSKSGSEEMSTRLKKLLDIIGIKCPIEVRTLHSFFYSLIRTFGINGQKVISEGTRIKYIKEACKEAGYICKDDDLEVINNLLSYKINNLLNDEDTISSSACTLSDLSLEQFRAIRKGYDVKKYKNNYIDFDDMQIYLYKWLCKDTKSDNDETRNTGIGVRNYCRAMYDYFYIDEAQDTSKIQYEIIKAMITNPETGLIDKGFVFMGDDDQCIYKWRGASPETILTLTTSVELRTFLLSTNYRCLDNIVNFAACSIKYNNYRYQKSIKASEQGGSINIVQTNSNDLYEMSKKACEIIDDMVKHGVRKRDIAVLCRNNVHASILGNMLIDYKIYSTMPVEMSLTGNFIFRDVKNIMYIADNTPNGKYANEVLWKLCTYMTVTISRSIGSFQNSTGMDITDTLAYILRDIFKRDNIDINKRSNVNFKIHEKLAYSLTKIKPETLKSIESLYSIMSSNTKTVEQKFRELSTLYIMSTSYMYREEDKSRCVSGIVHYIQDIVKQKGFKDALEYLNVTEQLEHGTFAVTGETVKLMTIHGAKGKEWQNVILFACDDEAIPGIGRLRRMAEKGSTKADMYSVIDEERRLYYVACTRAKENLTIITSLHPSEFMLESMGEYSEVTGTNNENIAYMVEGGYNTHKIVDNKCVPVLEQPEDEKVK